MRLAADDRHHERKAEQTRAHERRGRPAHADPDRERVLERARIHPLAAECRAELTRPLGLLLIADLEQQLELLLEERVVVAQIEAEERERVDERAASDDHLRATLCDQVER